MNIQAAPTAPSPERIYLDEGGVLVTSTRVVSGAQTYPVAAIAAVSIAHQPAKYGGPIFWMLAGAALAIFGGGVVFLLVGIGIAIAAIAVIRSRKATYYLQVQNAAGTPKVVDSTDRALIERISAAVSQAIVDRG